MTEPLAAAMGDLASGLIRAFPGEAAVELEKAPDEEAVALLTEVSPETAARLIENLTPVGAQRLLERLTPAAAGSVLAKLDLPRAAALLARFDPAPREALLKHVPGKEAKELTELATYPPDTAGSLMDPRVMAFHPQMAVTEVLEQLRRLPQKKATELFLVDSDGKLVGAVPLQALVIADPGQQLQELMGPPPVPIQATSSANEVIEALTGQTMASVVAVDLDHRLLGVLRRDSLIQAARQEASADAQAMVGAGKEERALSPVSLAVRKRLPWLVVNLGTAFLAASVVALFESTIARFTALAVLLPVVAGQSGNTGAQALAVTMRGLALREIRTRHALVVCFKEVRAGLFNGVGIALITSAAVLVWSRSVGLAAVIGISMVLSMMAAGLAGAAIPMLLTVLKQDPAQSSSIVLTTVTDVVGFLSFLGIATLLSAMIWFPTPPKSVKGGEGRVKIRP